MRQVDILVYNILSGAVSSRGTCIDLYDYFARTIDNKTNGRYEFQEWGFDFQHAADKVRRDYIKFYNNLSKARKATIAKGETDERDAECLERWRTDDLVFVYYLVEEDGEDLKITRKKVIFPKNTSIEEKVDYYENFKFPEND